LLVLTPAERRAALLLAGLLALGAVTDLVGARRVPAPSASGAASADTAWAAAPAAPAALASRDRLAASPEPLDLNRASSRELDALPGVGPVLASRIIEHRTRHGAFRSTEDLRAVRGFGPALFARLEPLVRVSPAGAAADSAAPSRAAAAALRGPR
jgi:competence protein ComEA